MQTYQVNTGFHSSNHLQDSTFQELINKGYSFPFKQVLESTVNCLKREPELFWGFTFIHSLVLIFFSFLPFIGGLVMGIYLLSTTASALIISNKLVKGDRVIFIDLWSGSYYLLDLFILGMKEALFIVLPFLTIFLLNIIIINQVLQTILYGVVGLWSLYFIVNCSWSSLLVLLYQIEDWDAINLSRRLIRHHWWIFLGLFILPLFTFVLGIIGIIVQIGLLFFINLMYCNVLMNAVQEIEE